MNLKAMLANRPKAIQSALMPEILAKWDSSLKAQDDGATIGVYDVIGEDYWGEGMTASRVAGILRSIGDKPVTVAINSPGGDVFEGIAIYNLLKEHSQPVTVKIIGIAASAASIIALAGDKVQIAKSAFFMIHNAWTIAVGNRHDMLAVADFLEPFDNAMAEVYADFSGLSISEVTDMMDKETYLNGTQAIEKGLATELLDSDKITNTESADAKALRADKILDTLMAKAGIPRSERRQLKKDYAGTQNATGEGTLNATYNPEKPLPLLDFTL